MKLHRSLSLVLILSILITACDITVNLQSTPVADANGTFAAQTVQVVLSAAPLATPTAASPSVPLATLDPSLPAPLASLPPGVAIDGTTAEPAPVCNDLGTHTAWTFDGKTYDVKIVNTPLAPNKKFVMAWTIQNTGSCIWDEAYVMSFQSGTKMTQEINFPLLQPGQTLSLGQSTTLTIEMTAPSATGEYRADWSLFNGQGKAIINFGIIINVGVTTTSTSLGKPGDLRYTYECTGGIMRVTLTWVDKASGEDGYRIYRNGTQVAVIAANSTAYVDVAPTIGTYIYTVAPFNNTGEAPVPVTVTPTAC